MTAQFVLRIDDVVPTFPWRKFAPLESALAEAGIKPVIGVVPSNVDPTLSFERPRRDFWDAIRNWQSQGWTVAQHGLRHEYTSRGRDYLGRVRKSEFLGYPQVQQEDMLWAGRQILEAEGVWTGTFMAPSHSFDEATLLALRATGFHTVTDGWGVYPYERFGVTLVPQLFATPKSLGFGVFTICLHVGPMSDARVSEIADQVLEIAHRFTSLPEAAKRREPAVVGSLMRQATRCGLPAYWGLRRRLGYS